MSTKLVNFLWVKWYEYRMDDSWIYTWVANIKVTQLKWAYEIKSRLHKYIYISMVI